MGQPLQPESHLPPAECRDQGLALQAECLSESSGHRVRRFSVPAEGEQEASNCHHLVQSPNLPSRNVVECCEPYTVPDQLVGCTGLKTIISRVTLDATQNRGVRKFAEAHNLKLVHESHFDCYHHILFPDDYYDDEKLYYYEEWIVDD